jgi:hypothetical protein
VIAWSSLACLPDDPRKMRGLFISGSVLVLARGDTGYRSSKSTKGVEIPQGMRCPMELAALPGGGTRAEVVLPEQAR